MRPTALVTPSCSCRGAATAPPKVLPRFVRPKGCPGGVAHCGCTLAHLDSVQRAFSAISFGQQAPRIRHGNHLATHLSIRLATQSAIYFATHGVI